MAQIAAQKLLVDSISTEKEIYPSSLDFLIHKSELVMSNFQCCYKDTE